MNVCTLLPVLGRAAAVLISGLVIALPGHCNEDGAGGEVRFTVGATGVLDDQRDAMARIEYHFDKKLILDITPFLTTGVATDGSSYIGGGLAYRRDLGKEWRVTLASGPGYYDRNGGTVLGHKLEFISYIELAREVYPGFWMGVNVGHISNAGFGKVNPGREMLGLTYSFRPRSRARSQPRE